MNITIYQINDRRDVNNVAFRGYDFTQTRQRVSGVESVIYDKIYTGNIPARDLEDVYYIFNQRHPEDFRGHSLSVSDVVEVSNCSTVVDGFYFCDSFGFRKVDFDPAKTQESEFYNMRFQDPQTLVNPETGLIHMEARLGISLEVTPDEYKALVSGKSDAETILMGLIRSDRCIAGGDTYFPGPWNEETLLDDLNFDLPSFSLYAPIEKKPSLDEKIQESETRAASQKQEPGTGKDNDIMR